MGRGCRKNSAAGRVCAEEGRRTCKGLPPKERPVGARTQPRQCGGVSGLPGSSASELSPRRVHGARSPGTAEDPFPHRNLLGSKLLGCRGSLLGPVAVPARAWPSGSSCPLPPSSREERGAILPVRGPLLSRGHPDCLGLV